MSSLDLADNKIKNVRALIYKDIDGLRSFLLTQELSGIYTIPGGCKDVEDVDMLSALKRELYEELGLNIDSCVVMDANISREYENLYKNPASERFRKITHISIYFIHCTGQEDIQPGEEIRGTEWLDGSSALNKLSGAHMKELFAEGLHLLCK